MPVRGLCPPGLTHPACYCYIYFAGVPAPQCIPVAISCLEEKGYVIVNSSVNRMYTGLLILQMLFHLKGTTFFKLNKYILYANCMQLYFDIDGIDCKIIYMGFKHFLHIFLCYYDPY
jgi:hypothetical protein